MSHHGRPGTRPFGNIAVNFLGLEGGDHGGEVLHGRHLVHSGDLVHHRVVEGGELARDLGPAKVLQGLGLRIGSILPNHHDQVRLVVGGGKVNLLFPLRRGAHPGQDGINFSRLESRREAIPVDFDDDQLLAQTPGNLLGHPDVIALGVLPRTVGNRDSPMAVRRLRPVEGGIVDFHADGEGVLLPHRHGGPVEGPDEKKSEDHEAGQDCLFDLSVHANLLCCRSQRQ